MCALPSLPYLGFGIGLRTPHFGHILEQTPAVDFFEIISENFIDSQGRPRHVLRQVAERFPIVMHGVSLSIGSADLLNWEYLKKLKRLADETKAVWVSDHLCWTGLGGHNSHDLLPLPLNEETLHYVGDRVRQVQDFLERPLVLENPSTYLTFRDSTLSEWEFLTRLTADSDCRLLLDVNNIYVSCRNHDWDPWQYLHGVPHDRVVQFHLAGHTDYGSHCIDSHDGHVVSAVWELYQEALRLAGHASTLIEWDAKIPPFEEVHAEALKAKAMATGKIEPVRRSIDASQSGSGCVART